MASISVQNIRQLHVSIFWCNNMKWKYCWNQMLFQRQCCFMITITFDCWLTRITATDSDLIHNTPDRSKQYNQLNSSTNMSFGHCSNAIIECARIIPKLNVYPHDYPYHDDADDHLNQSINTGNFNELWHCIWHFSKNDPTDPTIEYPNVTIQKKPLIPLVPVQSIAIAITESLRLTMAFWDNLYPKCWFQKT